jgi:hypothetical protein
VHRRAHLTAALAVAALAPLLTAGCSAPLVQPAPRAEDPACARALGAAPQKLLGQDRSDVRGAGALAWGDPLIVLRCGYPGVGATSDACLEVEGVDWVVADPNADPVVFAAFGRDPTVQLAVPASYGRSNAAASLVGLAPVARALPVNGRTCS